MKAENTIPLSSGVPRVGFLQNILCQPEKAVWAVPEHCLLHLSSWWPDEGPALACGLTHMWPQREVVKRHECPGPKTQAHWILIHMAIYKTFSSLFPTFPECPHEDLSCWPKELLIAPPGS